MKRLFLNLLICFLVSSSGALAGIVVSPKGTSDGTSETADRPNYSDIYEARRDALIAAYPTMFQPFEFTAPSGEQPQCDTSKGGQTYAILIGADGRGLGTYILPGPANDVSLLAGTLASRGVDPANIHTLLGTNASRRDLRVTLETVLPLLDCNDSAILYFGGHSVHTDFFEGFGEEEYGSLNINSDWLMSQYARDDAMMTDFVENQPYLVLNTAEGEGADYLSAADVSEIALSIRNTGANLTYVGDSNYAAGAKLHIRHLNRDPNTYWRAEVSQDAENQGMTTHLDKTEALLQPGHGQMTALYSSAESGMSVEMQLPTGAENGKVHGLFTYRLATAMIADSSLTAPSLARAMETFGYNEGSSRATSIIETTAPKTPILAELTKPLSDSDAIRILTPKNTRSAVMLETPSLTISGHIEWPEQTMIVLVNREQAFSKVNGEFQHEIELEQGLNQIEIVAMTRDNRQHRKVIEVNYEGEMQALLGTGVRYAIMIGNQTYGAGTGMPALKTPFADIQAVAVELTGSYGFQTSATLPDGSALNLMLKDAGKTQIETVLFQMSRIAGEKDTVLVYYGGHGIYEQMTDTAFWVPADAVSGVPPTYLSASHISEALLRLQAGNVLVISDSCYSGGLLRAAAETGLQDDDDRMIALQRLAKRRSRVLITSGSLEPVADDGGDGHSVFARALLTGLRDNSEKAFSARELFSNHILPFVVGQSQQEPQFRPIARSGHEGGDIVFVRRP